MTDIDPNIVDLVKAQLDANRIAQAELNLKRRLEAAQLETISSSEALKQEVRQMLVDVHKLLDYMRTTALQDDALRDYFENISHRIERLESGMMLVILDKLDSEPIKAEAKKLVYDISKEHKDRLRALHVKNIMKLEEQVAMFGVGQVPLDIQNILDAEYEAIRGLE